MNDSCRISNSCSGEENAVDAPKIDILSDTYTMFVLSMIMASVLAIPVIIGVTQAAAMWRLIKKS